MSRHNQMMIDDDWVQSESPGWCVFDGSLDMIDGPHATIEEAETAARAHRDSAVPEEHYETLVAWSWDDGATRESPQSWRANWDDVTP